MLQWKGYGLYVWEWWKKFEPGIDDYAEGCSVYEEIDRIMEGMSRLKGLSLLIFYDGQFGDVPLSFGNKTQTHFPIIQRHLIHCPLDINIIRVIHYPP